MLPAKKRFQFFSSLILALSLVAGTVPSADVHRTR